MATILTNNEHYKGIANTIRDFIGIDNKWKPEELSNAVFEGLGMAYDYGSVDGYDWGYEMGLEEGKYQSQEEIENIKTQAYNDFWNLFQEDGNRVNYNCAFMPLNFNSDNFKPKYSFKPTTAQDMFNNCPSLRDNKATKEFLTGKQVVMKDIEEELGIVFDFSNCANFVRAFSGCLFSELNVIDMRKVSAKGNTSLAFYGGYLNAGEIRDTFALKKIEKIIVNETTPIDNGTFNYQINLTHIRFEGVIGTDLAFRHSPLDKDSIENIISHLSDNTTGLTLTLNFDAVDKAYNPEGWWDWTEDDYTPIEWLDLIATKPNWNIVFA